MYHQIIIVKVTILLIVLSIEKIRIINFLVFYFDEVIIISHANKSFCIKKNKNQKLKVTIREKEISIDDTATTIYPSIVHFILLIVSKNIHKLTLFY